jgi:hypothetical protein
MPTATTVFIPPPYSSTQLDKEKLDKEKLDKEKLDKEKLDKEKLDKEKSDKEKSNKKRSDKSWNSYQSWESPGPGFCPSCPEPAPCPACARCPESPFECQKVSTHGTTNSGYLPRAVLADFSNFGR